MRPVTLVLGFAVFVLGCFWLLRTEILPRLRPPPPLPRLWEVTDFALTERSGQPVTLADLKGHVWVADLFYTTCPGPCPMLSKRLAEVQSALGNEANVRLVSVSSDPDSDTPEALRKYAGTYGAGQHWLFLTGPKAEIYRFANAALKLGVAEDPQNATDRIIHATKFVLVDRAGYARGFYEGITGNTKALLRDIRRLESES